MKILSYNPVFSEFGKGLWATKDTSLTVVCDMLVETQGFESRVGVMFEFHADREGMSFPFETERWIRDEFIQNMTPKDALPVAKKILAEIDKDHRCFHNINGYVNFDKVARK